MLVLSRFRISVEVWYWPVAARELDVESIRSSVFGALGSEEEIRARSVAEGLAAAFRPDDRLETIRAMGLHGVSERLQCRFLYCCSWLEIGVGDHACDCSPVAGNYCQIHQLCPVCARKRSASLVKEYSDKLVEVVSRYPVVHLVLTFPDSGIRTVTAAKGSCELMGRHVAKAVKSCNKYGCGPFRDCPGGIFSFEITYNEKSDHFHPHIHALVACPGEVDDGDLELRRSGPSGFRGKWKPVRGSQRLHPADFQRRVK